LFTLSRTILQSSCVSFALMACVSLVHADDEAPSQNFEDNVEGVEFPQWPARATVNKDIIPPPPPGPYMSTALGDYSIHGPRFARQVNRPEMGFDSANVPMDIYSPDIPWPKDLRAPNPSNTWMPEEGYKYAPKDSQSMPKPRIYRPPVNNMITLPGMNNSYRIPSMGFMPNNFKQQTTPGNYYQPRYQYPVNNLYRKPEAAVNSSPYPLSNKPRY